MDEQLHLSLDPYQGHALTQTFMVHFSPLAKARNLMKNSGLQRSPLDLIDHDHLRHLHLCDILEQIADGLPDDVDKKLCQQAALALKFELPLHHRDEEKGLFPLLQAHIGENIGIDAIIIRLCEEHAADESFAEELCEELEKLAMTGSAPNPETLGYMLRGFFASHRRHIHWEQAILMPMARQILNSEGLKTLGDTLLSHRLTKKPPQSALA